MFTKLLGLTFPVRSWGPYTEKQTRWIGVLDLILAIGLIAALMVGIAMAIAFMRATNKI